MYRATEEVRTENGNYLYASYCGDTAMAYQVVERGAPYTLAYRMFFREFYNKTSHI